MEDHALSLLKAEKEAGKKGADRLMKHLEPRSIDSVEQVNPRTPWFNEPDCMNCHVEFEPPETDESEFNLWTKGLNQLFRTRTDDVGIMCQACHGSISSWGEQKLQSMSYHRYGRRNPSS